MSDGPFLCRYSQLIWGESHLVGCGYAYYHDSSRGYTKVYVCNYGPGGNIAGYAPYQTGRPACPLYGTKPSSKYPGLCCEYHRLRATSPMPPCNTVGSRLMSRQQLEAACRRLTRGSEKRSDFDARSDMAISLS